MAVEGGAAEFVFVGGLGGGAAHAAATIKAKTVTRSFFMIRLLNLLGERVRFIAN